MNFVLSVLTLEELGASGNKGLAGILINPVHANAVAGLATSGETARLLFIHPFAIGCSVMHVVILLGMEH